MDNRNLVLAFVLSMLVLWGWGVMFPAPELDEQATISRDAELDSSSAKTNVDARKAETANVNQEQKASSVSAAPSDRIIASMNNDKMHVDVNEKGWLVRSSLHEYQQSLDLDSPDVAVLEDTDRHNLYISSGILKEKTSAFKLIENQNNRIVIQAKLAQGQTWTRTISLNDNQYVIDVNDRISQGGSVQLFSQIVEKYPNKDASNFQEFVGPVGFINQTLTEIHYDDLDDSGQRLLSVGGWTSITSRYFIAAIIGEQDQEYRYYFKGDGRTYQAGMIADAQMDGNDSVFKARYYIGPKSIPIMET